MKLKSDLVKYYVHLGNVIKSQLLDMADQGFISSDDVYELSLLVKRETDAFVWVSIQSISGDAFEPEDSVVLKMVNEGCYHPSFSETRLNQYFSDYSSVFDYLGFGDAAQLLMLANLIWYVFVARKNADDFDFMTGGPLLIGDLTLSARVKRFVSVLFGATHKINIELSEIHKRAEKNKEKNVVTKDTKKDRKKGKGSSGKSVAIVILSVLLVLSIGACVILFFYARDIEDKRLDLAHRYALADSKIQGLQHSVYVLNQEVEDTNALEHSLKKHRAFNVLREWIEQNAVPFANGNEYYQIDSPALFIENMPMFVGVSHAVASDVGLVEVIITLMGDEYIYDARVYFFDSIDDILVEFNQVTADDYRELYAAEKEYKADADYSWMRGKYTLDGETFDSVKDTGMYVSKEKSIEYYSLCVKMLVEGLKVFAEEIDDSIASYPGVTDSDDILGCLRLGRLS